jgi:hypothetical protein
MRTHSRGADSPTANVLYAFSSNIRPLYAQDILNVLAAPTGTSYTFRYEKQYIGESLASVWDIRLKDRKVLIHFSLQQAARYHEPVFFPVRAANVIQAQRLGDDIFLLEFVLDRIIGLPEPDASKDDYRFAAQAHAYTQYLRKHVGDAALPYGVAVSEGPDVTLDARAPLDASSDEIQLFGRNARYLSLADAFKESWFVHVLGLATGDDQPLKDVRLGRLSREDHLFSLVAGTTYKLHVLQRQPREVTAEASFSIDADEHVLRVIGRKGFTIGSRYDRILIPVHALEPSGSESRTILVLRPDGVGGPTVNIPVRVTPSPTDAQAAIGTGVSLLLLGVLSFKPEAPVWEKALFVAAALFAHLYARSRTLVAAWRGRRP